MTSDPFTDRLSDYADGELDAAERAAVEAHLAGCAPCRTALDELGAVAARAKALSDPAPPDIVIVPNPGTNYEPSTNPALPAVQAEHGGFNENETHVPLLVVGGLANGRTINPGIVRAAVTTTQIAPTILELLNLDPNALQAVRLEDVKVLTGIKGDNGKSAH